MKQKSDAAGVIKDWIVFIERQSGLKVGEVHTDNGGEFVNGTLQQFFRESGIYFTQSTPYTPTENSIVERSQRTLFDKVRAA